MFERHELIPEDDGYVLVLYVRSYVEEFSTQLDEPMDERNTRLLKAKIKRYIREHVPDIRIVRVKIMMGSILLGSLTIK
ncbi:hypothetical protein LSG31_16510 [Fodinisporobacter ferrooxydans]|uniref:Uncharacterized protein n=1 Tax=Fodinisporobacter ferrooxydans TaxID=2901836 RepID=A0ABY4CG63_9BACL|nr:hypothetical protein LSG31_16510 [Alicyclobacillaceae bacterium MYW30-H2]